MPQNGMNYTSRSGGTRRNTCEANGQVPGTGLVNGADVYNGYIAAATRTSESAPAGTLNDTNSQCMVNGYINHGYKGKSRKALPPRTLRKQGSRISAVADAPAAGRVSNEAIPGGISVSGAASLDVVSLPCNCDQMAPKPSLSATAKKPRKEKKFGHKKRPPARPPHKEEDWENEIQEVKASDWEKISFGVQPYGPEDVLHFALRDLTLQHRDTVQPPVTANYSPAVHHPHPVRWSCYSILTEPDQFADADE